MLYSILKIEFSVAYFLFIQMTIQSEIIKTLLTINENLLEETIINANLYLIKYLIDNHPEPDRDDTNSKALQYAIKHNKLEVKLCAYLIKNYPITFKNKPIWYIWNPLQYAIECNHIEIVRYLLSNDTNTDIYSHSNKIFITKSQYYHALCWAAGYGHLDILNTLIEKKINVNGPDGDSYALYIASERNQLEAAQILINKQCDIHAKDCRALVIAAKCGHFDMVKLLVENSDNLHGIYARKIQSSEHNIPRGYFRQSIGPHSPYNLHGPRHIQYGKNKALIQAYIAGHTKIVEYLSAHGALYRDDESFIKYCLSS